MVDSSTKLRSRLIRWKKPMVAFLLGQPSVQLLSLITGFCLIRWLTVDQFAMFGIALAFQATVNQLVDLGFTGSIVALAGSEGKNPNVLGGYVRSARYWRTKFQIVVLVGAAIAFWLITWHQPWPPLIKVLLFGSVALGVFFQGWTMYGAPLLVNRSLQKYYSPKIQGAVLRFSFCAALYATGFLSAWAAALLSTLSLGYTGLCYRHSSRSYINEPEQSVPGYNVEMWRYLTPLMPGLVFGALQSQILIGLIAIFGSSQNIAEVTALGRVGQIFLMLGAFNAVFIEPYIASVSRSLLPRRYLQIFSAALCISVAVGIVGFAFPKPLLWLMGDKYSDLAQEIGWVVLTACLSYMGGVMWTMHSARKWVFWWGTAAYISVLVVTQIVCIATLDLSQTLSVVWFGVITSAVVLVVHAATAAYGFSIQPSPHPSSP